MTESAGQERRGGQIVWQRGVVEQVIDETYRVKSFHISLPEWRPFRPGQHLDVRLTAPDGYQALRSYSIASPPEMSGTMDITVELVDDGEVSTWFHEVAALGDVIELRGPIGGPFTWTVDEGGPLLLIGGGAGVVPLMSMLRHRRAAGGTTPTLLLYSSRTIDDVIYRNELAGLANDGGGVDVVHTLTRSQPPGWIGHRRRVDPDMLNEAIARLGLPRGVFVCGPTNFVENVAVGLVSLGVGADLIRTERFGPSG
ncbi:MAG: ferredoxin reductase [Actinomycetota bacterium]